MEFPEFSSESKKNKINFEEKNVLLLSTKRCWCCVCSFSLSVSFASFSSGWKSAFDWWLGLAFCSVFSERGLIRFLRWLLCSLLDVKESLSNVYCCCCLCCCCLNVAKKNRDFFKSHIRFDRARCSGTRRRCARWRCSPHPLWWTPPDREYPTTPTWPIVRASIL